MMNAVECLTDETLRAYQGGAVSDTVFETVSRHLHSCPSCLNRLEALDADWDPLTAALRGQRLQPQAVADPVVDQAVAAVLNQQPTHVAKRRRLPTGAFDPVAIGGMLNEYLLVAKLGGGGMGAVYRAVHTRLDKEVALKVVQPRFRAEQHVRDRFEREMKAIGKLRHPHIVLATDAGEAGGVLYLVMEIEQGTDLADYVRQRGPLPVAEACEYARQAALGPQAAHEAGLVHRDVKPSNLFRTNTGQIKLLDLGLARLHDEERAPDSAAPTTASEVATGSTASGFARTQGQMGTDDYMAPEQWLDAHEVDARTDLYGLGCVLHFLLLGKAPFDSPEHAARDQKRAAHLQAPPPALRQQRHDVPPKLDRLVRHLLAKKAEDRPPGPAAVAAALAEFTGQPSRRRWLVGGAGLLTAAAIVSAALILPLGHPPAPEQKQQSPPAADGNAASREANTPKPGRLPMTPAEAKDLQDRWAKHTGRDVETKNSIGMTMRLVPPGRFAAWGTTTVVISRPFEISATEVTRAQFAAFVQDKNYRTEAETSGKGGFVMLPSKGRPQARAGPDFVWWTPGYPDPADDHPVVHVTWQDAVAFCSWLSLREKRNYFLPTIAEWQWACRAGADTRFYYGDDPNHLGEHAWHAANSQGQVQAVAKKLPNHWGLFDMFGNVQELCRDGPGSWPAGEVVDPLMPLGAQTRFVLGGHYLSQVTERADDPAVSYKRGGAIKHQEASTVTGFRVVRKQ